MSNGVKRRMYNPFLMMCRFFALIRLTRCNRAVRNKQPIFAFSTFFFSLSLSRGLRGLTYGLTEQKWSGGVSRCTGCRYIRGTFFEESILEGRTNTKVGMRKCWLRLGYWVISNLKFSLDETRWRQKEMTETGLSYFI